MNATANSAKAATYGRTRGAGSNSTIAAEISTPSPIPPALATPLCRPTALASRRGWRSSSAALAALRVSPVASPCKARAANSHATESASMNITVAAISEPSATSRTGLRPT